MQGEPAARLGLAWLKHPALAFQEGTSRKERKMPGRIEGWEAVFVGVAVPFWKIKLKELQAKLTPEQKDDKKK